MSDKETLLTFPCKFPLKVMGIHHDAFEDNILIIARKHIANLQRDAVQSRLSKTGKYLAITITFQAESRAQLDDLYRELSAHHDVRMVL
ncbi:MAG: DUF493 domain-containing protein [Mariprofundaceae bacterium]|nr:DUF493 domain-containing protein [Mariprofundaceae bacterium]